MSKQLDPKQRRAIWAALAVVPIVAIGVVYFARRDTVSAEKPAEIAAADSPQRMLQLPVQPSGAAPKPQSRAVGQPAPESDSAEEGELNEPAELSEAAELAAPDQMPLPATPLLEVALAPRAPVTSEPLVPPVIELKAEFATRTSTTNAPLVPPLVEIKSEVKPRR
ncbi:MAG: hypothetical protein IPK82_10825 [Polyangiaceae bacterium]|nr:hypothetical protein [Polyangiaceae bacterium]